MTESMHLTAEFQLEAMSLEAMSLEVPETPGHPNKRPFSGILTRVDEPSDGPVGGSGGRRVIMSAATAEAALPTLIGMAVDMAPDLDAHNEVHKVGLITEARVEGNAVVIAGFLYARDFPQDMERIDQNLGKLGFSFEFTPTKAQVTVDNLLQVDEGFFTGAAILLAKKAAYQSTSLAAASSQETPTMDEASFTALKDSLDALAASMATLTTKVETLEKASPLMAASECAALVEPHAGMLEECAAQMQAAAIGMHPTAGHVKTLRHMANSMRASAAMGQIPHVYRDHDMFASVAVTAAADTPQEDKELNAELKAQLAALNETIASLGTKLGDLQASARQGSAPPVRKTLSPEIATLLAKRGLGNLTANEDGSVDEHALDQALRTTDMGPEARIAFKNSVFRAQDKRTA